jgi:hypothetical protein
LQSGSAKQERERVAIAIQAIRSGFTEREVVDRIGRPLRTQFPPFDPAEFPSNGGCESCKHKGSKTSGVPARRVTYEFRFPQEKKTVTIEELTIYYDEEARVIMVDRSSGMEFTSVWY